MQWFPRQGGIDQAIVLCHPMGETLARRPGLPKFLGDRVIHLRRLLLCHSPGLMGAGLLSAATGPVTVNVALPGRAIQHFAPCVGPAGQVYCSWLDFNAANFEDIANVNFVSPSVTG